jgi:hypothetical protein
MKRYKESILFNGDRGTFSEMISTLSMGKKTLNTLQTLAKTSHHIANKRE